MNRKQKFLNSKSFAIYYGTGRETSLSKYDIAVIEPLGHTESGINQIKASGTLAIAYLSAIEINPSDPVFRYLNDDDFLKKSGIRMSNEIFGNYLVDIRSQRWQKILFHQIARLIIGLGFDGLFIDTISNAEAPFVIQEYGLFIIQEAALFLSKIRQEYPDSIMIQNNSMEKLLSYTSGIVDGICWENPPVGSKKSQLWMQEVMNRLDIVKKQDNMKILVIYESNKEDDQRILKGFESKGYLTYLTPPGYLEIKD